MNSNLKICIVSQQYSNIFSGPGTYTNILIDFLLRRNFKITLIVPKSQYKVTTNENLKIIPVKNPSLNSHARWIPLGFSFSKALKMLTKETNFDIIHFTDLRDGFFVTNEYLKIGNINDTYITEFKSPNQLRKIYSDWIIRWLYYSFSRVIEKKYIETFHTIIANSNYTYNILKEYYPKIQNKLRICYKAINISYDPISILPKPKKDYCNILFVGGNMERKGLLTLILATNKLKNKYNLKVHVVGNDPKIDYYKNICRKLEVEKYIFFLGNVQPTHLKDYYSKADLFVLPSHEEALGISILEAMASNTPVIGSNVGGIPEIIENYWNGLLIEPGNEEMLAKMIIEIIDNDNLRKNIVANAKSTINNFSSEKMLDCTLDIYNKALKS